MVYHPHVLNPDRTYVFVGSIKNYIAWYLNDKDVGKGDIVSDKDMEMRSL